MNTQRKTDSNWDIQLDEVFCRACGTSYPAVYDGEGELAILDMAGRKVYGGCMYCGSPEGFRTRSFEELPEKCDQWDDCKYWQGACAVEEEEDF